MSFVVIFLLLTTDVIFCQEQYSRDVVITSDTIREFNNTRKPGSISDTYIKNGFELKIFEPIFSIPSIVEKKNNYPNGLYLAFYYPSNLPRIKGTYSNGDQNGKWFYWDEKGILKKTEIWRKGKLLKTRNYK